MKMTKTVISAFETRYHVDHPPEVEAEIERRREEGLLVTTRGRWGSNHILEVDKWYAETYPKSKLLWDGTIWDVRTNICVYSWFPENEVEGVYLKLRFDNI